MKFAIPEISWHNRDPVLSVDFQPKAGAMEPKRLATGGTDSHVLIWYISTTDTGSVNLEVAADLTRHQKAVNVVRWSPSGEYLASGDDESIIFIWKQKSEKESAPVVETQEEQYKETWIIYKTLRGHMEDVLDLSWSPNSEQLASGSVDNKLLIWDIHRGRYSSILSDHKGFVQGVSWDPKGKLIATTSSDRTFRTFDVASKKVVSRSSKATLPFPSDHPLYETKVRLYHDDTLQTFYRRLQFSPDGLLIAVPAGRIEPEQGKMDIKPINAVYIYTRYSLKVPVCVLPCGEPALAVRWARRPLELRADGPPPAVPGRARHLLALATKRCVLLYDTQQRTPLALISNVHYTRLTDLTWSPDGGTLVASSTDGFCSVVTFAAGELGKPAADLHLTEPMETQADEQQDEEKNKPEETKVNKTKLDSFIKFKAPSEKSPKKQKIEPNQKTPVKIDILEEVAMPSWSDNSSSEIIRPKESMDMDKPEILVIEDSEDIKLVYDETKSQSPQEVNPTVSLQDSKKNSPKESNSPNIAQMESQQMNTPKSSTSKTDESSSTNKDSNFLQQAKVTDMKEAVVVKSVQSPKAPRRVSFVTLSSPKNSKKK